MTEASNVLQKINKTHWLSEDKNIVYGIFSYTTSPWPNNNYVYQIYVRSYSIGYEYLADMNDQVGGIDNLGNIHYGPGFIGKLTDDNTIQWFGGRFGKWTKITNIPNPTADYYSQQSIQAMDNANTAYIKDKYDRGYPYYSQFPGN